MVLTRTGRGATNEIGQGSGQAAEPTVIAQFTDGENLRQDNQEKVLPRVLVVGDIGYRYPAPATHVYPPPQVPVYPQPPHAYPHQNPPPHAYPPQYPPPPPYYYQQQYQHFYQSQYQQPYYPPYQQPQQYQYCWDVYLNTS